MISDYSKEQTAFRFDKDLLAMMKIRAKSLGRSLNNYVCFLVTQDLKESMTLPRVSIPAQLDPEVGKLAGIMEAPSDAALEDDERLSEIWSR